MSKKFVPFVVCLVLICANALAQDPPTRTISISVSGSPIINSETTAQANITLGNSRTAWLGVNGPLSYECLAPSYYVYNSWLNMSGCELPGSGAPEGTFNLSVKIFANGGETTPSGISTIGGSPGTWDPSVSAEVSYQRATYTLSFDRNAIYMDDPLREAHGVLTRSVPARQETSLCLVATPALIGDPNVWNFCEPIAANSSSRSFTVTASSVSVPTNVVISGGGTAASILLSPVPGGQQTGSGPCRSKNCTQREGIAGQPINITNGNTWVEQTDYSLPGLAGGMALTRTWNSLWQSNSPVEVSGIFGHSWRSNFEARLQISTDWVKYWHGDGNLWTFNYDNVTGFYYLADPLDERATLTYDPTTERFTVTLDDKNRILFRANGYVDRFVDRNGNQTIAQYDEADRLLTITDSAGRVLSFTYGNSNFPGLATSISDAIGIVATYVYDTSGRLQQVTYADATHVTFNYDAQNLLLNVLDNEGKVLEAHTYDAQRRGLTSERAGGVEKVTVTYTRTGLTRVTDSKGNHTDYVYRLIGTRRFMDSINGPGCTSCGGRGTQVFSYDSRGNRLSSTDALGRTTFYTYDANGNVSSVTPPN
jgi:YD repeat-containing protein